MDIRKIIFLLSFLLPVFVLATAQFPDKLQYKGKKYPMFSNPLESYYSESNPRPKEIIKNSPRCTACWRGYIATWKIIDDSLFLKKVKAWKGLKKADLNEMFGTTYQNKRVFAEWFSGELRIPQGKMLSYVHMGYSSIFKKDIILSIKNGILVSEKEIDNKIQRPLFGFEYVTEKGLSYPIPAFATLCNSSNNTTSEIDEYRNITLNITANIEPISSICFKTPDTSFESTGTVWFDSTRAEKDDQKELNQLALDSLAMTFNDTYKLTNPVFQSKRFGSIGYFDCTSIDTTLVRVLTISNINTRAIVYLTFHKKIEATDAKKIADIIVENINLVEFSY